MERILDELLSIDQLDRALSESARRPVLLFKHSLTCPISSRAFSEFQTYLESPDSRVAYKLITVQTARDVSTSAAERLGVAPARGRKHERPVRCSPERGVLPWAVSHLNVGGAGPELHAMCLRGGTVDTGRERVNAKIVILSWR